MEWGRVVRGLIKLKNKAVKIQIDFLTIIEGILITSFHCSIKVTPKVKISNPTG